MRLIWRCVPGLLGAALAAASPAAAEDMVAEPNGALLGIIDEIRFGPSVSIQGSSPDGPLVNGQVLFTPFVPHLGGELLDMFLRPRPHLGVTVATDDGTSQVFGGVTWTFPIFDPLFLEASFGGTVHDGPLTGTGNEESLGCRLLFRESIGVGLALGAHWRVIASADHSSHASLCDGDNGGLTHAGVGVGYRF